MSIFSTMRNWLGGNANTTRTGTQQIQPASTVHQNVPIVNVDGAMQVSTVWACVNLLVETISSLPLMVYKAGADGSREISDDTLYKILHDSPNPRQTSQEFWEQMLLNFFLRGNAYARVQRDSRGKAVALWPLSSDQIEVIMLDDGTLVYRYFKNTNQQTEIIYLEKDILHIKGPGNGLVGMSRLDYMRSSVGLAIKTQDHTTKTYQANARRPGILMSSEVLTDAQRVALKKNFGDIVSGSDKELYVLEAQFKFDPLGMTPTDIQLLESRKFSVQDLARWFGVPSVLINDTGESTALGSSIAQIVDGFHRLTLRPQLERIEQAIMKRVLTPAQRVSGLTAEFNLDALLRASLAERMEIYSKGVQNGIYNRNEPRKRENLKPYPGGDVYTAQVNLMPVDLLGRQPASGNVPDEPIEQ
jgi:HK97 family phage portal protein